MIALLRFELWRAFWLALILTLVLAAPLLEHNEGGLLGLVQGPVSSRELLRFAIGMPFGLAVVQFGIDRWLGLLPVLLHRGTKARQIHRAKSIVGLGFAALFLVGVVLLEWRVEVRSGEPAYNSLRGLWVLPQILAVGLLSFSAGELAVRISRKGTLLTGLRVILAYAALLGAHHWARSASGALAEPWGLVAYCALVGSAGASLWIYSNRSFGRPESTRAPSELRLVLGSVLATALIWPNLDQLRIQTGTLLRGRLEPNYPNLRVNAEGQVGIHRKEGKQQVLAALDGSWREPVSTAESKQWKPLAIQDSDLLALVPEEITAKARGQRVREGEFQLQESVRHLGMSGALPPEAFDSLGGDFEFAQRTEPGLAEACLVLPAGRVVLRISASLPKSNRRGESDIARAEFPLDRPDGSRFSKGLVRLFDDVIYEPVDRSFWRLRPRLGLAALEALEAPPGHYQRALFLYDGEKWAREARLLPTGALVETDAGRYGFEDGRWVPFQKQASAAPLAELEREELPPRLVVDGDLLGRHRASVVVGSDQTLAPVDVARRGSSADSRRRVLLGLRLMAPPMTALASNDPALGSLSLGQGLPDWVRPVHALIGLLSAAFALGRQRTRFGRLLAALVAGLLGPLAFLALHALRQDLDQAQRAGPRGPRALPPIFSDAA